MRWHLSKGGLDVQMHRVQTEPDFRAALRDLKPDIILSDFSLPQFDGLRALAIAVEDTPETPFLFVSGTIGEERAIDALRRGATDYVLKSNLSRLASAVERALRETGGEIAVAHRDYARTAYGWALEDTSSFVKLIADPKTRRLLSAHIIGPQAAALIQPLVQAIYLDNTVDQLAHDVLYIHPALTEVVAEALLELFGHLT